MINELQLFLTISLCTLIWLIQIVHYPSFEFYEEHSFTKGMLAHQKRISYIVLPLMIAELAATIFDFYNEINVSTLVVFALVFFIWLSTFLVQVPLHRQLTIQKSHKTIRKLILTNWVRTGLWSFKLLYLLNLKTA